MESVLNRVEEMSDHIELHTCPSIWLEIQFDLYVVAYFLSQVIFVSCFCFWVWQCTLMKLKQRKNEKLPKIKN